MNRLVLILALLGIFLVTAGLNFVLRSDRTRPNWEYAPQMAHSPRANAFAVSTVFADGKTLREPPQGTSPRGLQSLHYAATPEDALRAGAELASPVSAEDRAAVDRGAFVFTTFCAPCHGAGGRGDGPVARRGYPPPPSLLLEHAIAMPDGQIFHVLTYGQGNMPSYASQLSREDRWSSIAYLRTLQHPAVDPGGTP